MESAVSHYALCDVVKHIYIIWSESSAPPERFTAKFAGRSHPTISFLVQTKDSLNNRFRPLDGLPHTDGIFAVDDDMRVSCDDLSLGYEVNLFFEIHSCSYAYFIGYIFVHLGLAQ